MAFDNGFVSVYKGSIKEVNSTFSQTNRDGKGQIWTSEKVVEFGILAGTFYIGGRLINRTINKAVKSGQEAAP